MLTGPPTRRRSSLQKEDRPPYRSRRPMRGPIPAAQESTGSSACSRRIGAGTQSFVAPRRFIDHSRSGSPGRFTSLDRGIRRLSARDDEEIAWTPQPRTGDCRGGRSRSPPPPVAFSLPRTPWPARRASGLGAGVGRQTGHSRIPSAAQASSVPGESKEAAVPGPARGDCTVMVG